ncbi:unnamed protein product, partial [Closterium sp. NIES-54]
CPFSAAGMAFQLEKKPTRALSHDEEIWVKDLLKRNMEQHFAPSTWPQVLSGKLTEAVEPDAVYLFLKQPKANKATTGVQIVAAESMVQCMLEARSTEASGSMTHANPSQFQGCQSSRLQMQEDRCFQQHVQHQKPPNPRPARSVKSQRQNDNSLYQAMNGGCMGIDGTAECKHVGFMHFRIVEENEMASLYVYELQVEAEYQGMGIGSKLMRIAELMAKKCELEAIFLTVQKENKSARALYMEKLGFQTADHSPAK